ncbi:MAG: HXXEE domain-containing protein [Oscillospiraceae bacterium]|nr:HXXEE domain-containing protein [Oscillospiraceae bacterium]
MEAIIFLFCLTIHNIEEALWFNDWRIKNMPNKRKTYKKEYFIFSVLGITILAYLSVGLFLLFPDIIYLEYIFIGFVCAMLINTIMPHLLLTIIYREYCPGLFTGCCLLAPFNIIILAKTLNKGFSISEVIISTLIVGVVLLSSIPMFEIIAKKILKKKEKQQL